MQDSDSSVDEFAPPEQEDDEGDEFMEEDATAPDEEDDDSQTVSDDEDAPRGESICDIDSDLGSDIPRSKRKGKPSGLKSSTAALSKVVGHGRNQTRKMATAAGGKTRQRMIEDWMKGGQEQRFRTFFGPTVEDMYPVLQTKDHWTKQLTLPSRDEGNLRRSFFASAEAGEKDVKSTRKWYADAGREAFSKGQKSKMITEEEGRGYMVNDGPETTNFLLGGVKQPNIYTLKKGEYMSLSTPFQPASTRRGWMFNLGARIQEAQWVPNEKGSTQYLAVAVEQKRPGKPKHKPMENPKASAFTASKPFSSAIQIWAFDAVSNGRMDPSKPPRLENVICTEWGAPRFFQWWPIGAKDVVEPDVQDNVRLGLLAGVWSDGKLRILDVTFQKLASSQKPSYVHYAEAAFELEMPETIPTCLHWLSGTSLAAATASGSLAIWSLNRNNGLTTKPWFYKQIADTYILSLSSGYPSRPQMISVTTADGFARLFDLRSPALDACSAARGRALVLCQGWHEHTQSFVMADEHYLLKHSSIRRFHGNMYSMRLASAIVCCATSPVHPGVLVGCADGTVETSNTAPKIFNVKQLPWQQIWFKHEWRPPIEQLNLTLPEPSPAQTDSNIQQAGPSAAKKMAAQARPIGITMPPSSSNVPASVLSKPLTRIAEGYKPRQLGMTEESTRAKYDMKFITVYEEKSAIIKMAWNPNLKFGTWAVAGSNSGYLRVEDIGV
ncbi:hypothetical protein CC80DRAFT_312510 [Byssothecium circinans]|uniref:WD40 repeat-like protein n=1 Tax=Byssothecium circinans TaxID=147558 RepID=A0A6A5UAK9_9PLEO|nr:hypothetical protein CC80DRAFT_312510 [Byssothecium circinans]